MASFNCQLEPNWCQLKRVSVRNSVGCINLWAHREGFPSQWRREGCPGFRSLKYKPGKAEHRQLPGILAFSGFGCGYGQLLPVPAAWDFSAMVDYSLAGAKMNPSSLSCLCQGSWSQMGGKLRCHHWSWQCT